MRKAAMMIAMLTLAGATACKTVARQVMQEPVVTLSDIKLIGAGFQGGTLDIVLNVYNPNDFRLDGSRITYRVLADSVAVGGGSLDQKFTVQNGDSTQIRLPLNFTWSGLGAVARQLQNQGVVNYRVMGEIEVATPLGPFTRPYDQSGRYSVMRP